VNRLLSEEEPLLDLALNAVIEALRMAPDRYSIIFNTTEFATSWKNSSIGSGSRLTILQQLSCFLGCCSSNFCNEVCLFPEAY
jgi:hypothetical protein